MWEAQAEMAFIWKWAAMVSASSHGGRADVTLTCTCAGSGTLRRSGEVSDRFVYGTSACAGIGQPANLKTA